LCDEGNVCLKARSSDVAISPPSPILRNKPQHYPLPNPLRKVHRWVRE
jgi:hypothetical protein